MIEKLVIRDKNGKITKLRIVHFNEKTEKREVLVVRENLLSEREAWELTEEQQVKYLKVLGAKEIPKLEFDRVKLIMKMQEEVTG